MKNLREFSDEVVINGRASIDLATMEEAKCLEGSIRHVSRCKGDVNTAIAEYVAEHGIALGTTGAVLVGVNMWEGIFLGIGESERVYAMGRGK